MYIAKNMEAGKPKRGVISEQSQGCCFTLQWWYQRGERGCTKLNVD